jgi:hypothetical protein
VKAQSTPPNALRSRPPPPAAAEEASGSAIAACVASLGVCGWKARKSQCWTQAETKTSRRDRELGAPVPCYDSGFIAPFASKTLGTLLFVGPGFFFNLDSARHNRTAHTHTPKATPYAPQNVLTKITKATGAS